MEEILHFLSLLKNNNHRDWFNANKECYISALTRFEDVCNQFLLNSANFDSDMNKISAKDAIFRIYRDTRFAKDKTPYKTHLGAFLAFPNTRKSHRGGYYLHIEPKHSFMGIGVWGPQKSDLDAIRWSVYYDYQELVDILDKESFVQTFGTGLYEMEKLKRIPTGFPKDFTQPELLKHKHYLITHSFSDEELKVKDIVKTFVKIAQEGYPFLRFINNAIDENN